MRHSFRWLALVLTALLAACSTTSTQPSRAQSQTAPSGFLTDYSLLTPDPHDPGYRHYVAPGTSARQYRSFLIEPPEFIVNTRDTYKTLDPARIQAISKYYESRMASTLAQHYRVVDAPGPGVVRLRVAVVGLVEARPEFKMRNLIPVKALFDVARIVVDKSPQVLRMSIESQALDSQSGKLLGEAVDSRESKQTVAGASTPPSDDQIHDLIDFWVARFVARLDRANGYAAGPDGHNKM